MNYEIVNDIDDSDDDKKFFKNLGFADHNVIDTVDTAITKLKNK